jgi:hypothetical protein
MPSSGEAVRKQVTGFTIHDMMQSSHFVLLQTAVTTVLLNHMMQSAHFVQQSLLYYCITVMRYLDCCVCIIYLVLQKLHAWCFSACSCSETSEMMLLACQA